jgi:hypothetical protein
MSGPILGDLSKNRWSGGYMTRFIARLVGDKDEHAGQRCDSVSNEYQGLVSQERFKNCGDNISADMDGWKQSCHTSKPTMYPPITYYRTVPLILDNSYLVEKLTSSKIADTSVRISEVLKLLFQQFLNFSISHRYTSGPVLGALSNNRWLTGIVRTVSFFFKYTLKVPKFPHRVKFSLCFLNGFADSRRFPTKSKENESLRNRLDLQNWFLFYFTFLRLNPSEEAADIPRTYGKSPWGGKLGAFTVPLCKRERSVLSQC